MALEVDECSMGVQNFSKDFYFGDPLFPGLRKRGRGEAYMAERESWKWRFLECPVQQRLIVEVRNMPK